MSPIADFLALQGALITIGRKSLDADAMTGILDADSVPAALTAEAVPVFKTCRRDVVPKASGYALVTGRQIARMVGSDPVKVEAMIRAIRAVAMPDLGALDVI